MSEKRADIWGATVDGLTRRLDERERELAAIKAQKWKLTHAFARQYDALCAADAWMREARDELENYALGLNHRHRAAYARAVRDLIDRCPTLSPLPANDELGGEDVWSTDEANDDAAAV